jgi:surfeit locus 1 family protein
VTRRIPVVSSVVVLAAVATMIALGVWQLHRKEWKEALITRYLAAETMNSDVPWPSSPAEYPGALYRHTRVNCAEVERMSAISGRSAVGLSGWAHIAHCQLVGGGEAYIGLGWSNDSASPHWNGGELGGFIAGSEDRVRLVAAPPQAGLAQLALPDPRDLPNNHLSYAVQWFLFAATALVIYVLALRKKWQAENPR